MRARHEVLEVLVAEGDPPVAVRVGADGRRGAGLQFSGLQYVAHVAQRVPEIGALDLPEAETGLRRGLEVEFRFHRHVRRAQPEEVLGVGAPRRRALGATAEHVPYRIEEAHTPSGLPSTFNPRPALPATRER